MDDVRPTEPHPAKVNEDERLPYSAPRLIDLGTWEDLTEAAGNGAADGVLGFSGPV
jgi:hypothetical protein